MYAQKETQRMTPYEAESKTIDLLRLPLAIGVIFIHMNMKVHGNMVHWTDFGSMDAYRVFAIVVADNLAGIAVPLFFLFSGYLFFYKLKEWNLQVYKQKMKKRLVSLVLPYMLFNLLAVIGLIVNSTLINHNLMLNLHSWLGDGKFLRIFWNMHVTGGMNSTLGYHIPMDTPINVPLWFIRDLIMVSACTPLIYWLISKFGRWVVIVLGVCFVAYIGLPINGFRPNACFFFTFGAYLSINKHTLAETLYPHRYTIGVLALLLMAADIRLDGMPHEDIIDRLYLICGVISAFNVGLWFTLHYQPRISEVLGQSSFFVFATHTLPLPYLRRPIEWCKDNIWTNSSNALICSGQFLLVAAATTLCCLSMFGFLLWACPRVLNVLIGKRKRR